MQRPLVPILLFFFALCLFVLNGFFEYGHAYYLFPWLDIPMHIGSGFLVAFSVLTAIFHQRLLARRGASPIFVVVIAFWSAFAVGIVWEIVAPYLGHLAPSLGGWALDTTKDLINDVIGGLCAAGLFISKKYHVS